MAKQVINVGTIANDGTGDTLRNAMIKVNDNTDELYNGSNVDYCEFHLDAPPEVVAIDDDGVTYTKIPNMVLKLGVGFSVTTGTLTKINGDGIFLINGVSDLEVNKAVTITYALFVNGSEAPGESTPHTFTNQSKIENISITSISPITEDDDIDIRIKGDGVATNVTATVRKLDVTFLMCAR